MENESIDILTDERTLTDNEMAANVCRDEKTSEKDNRIENAETAENERIERTEETDGTDGTDGTEIKHIITRKISKPNVAAPSALRVAAYCRVSTEDPLQEFSLEAQEEHWRSYINHHRKSAEKDSPDWQLTGIFSDAGISGTKAETRPELMRLIDACRAGEVDLVLTKSISRFSRNITDCLHLVRTLKSLGVGVVFEKEHIDTSSMTSEFFLSILSSFAEEESRSLSKNVKLGYVHRFQMGEFAYKRPPYGYRVIEQALEPEPMEAVVVEEIFDAVLQGKTLGAISRDLNDRRVPTKYNATWTRNTIVNMVSNITYTGDCLLQKTWVDQDYEQHTNHGELDQYFVPDHHEGIVTREVYILANRILGFSNIYEKIREADPDLPMDEIDEVISTDSADSPAHVTDNNGDRHVTVIKAENSSKGHPQPQTDGPSSLRVAAYCRVSTDSDEQESSYEVQCSHYHELITAHPDWTLAGIYADEGISGTSRAHRDSFNQMIADAEAGKIDMILTKSISRFARNTLDCLSVVRKLKKLGVGISFEKEGLDTLDGNGEVILTILASIAQQESASISQNVRMGIQYRFQQGAPRVNCDRFLGYDKDKNGKLVINERQAGIVRRIYRDFLDGFSIDMIAGDLRREGVASGTGSTSWPSSSVRYILTNEKYAGDLLLQKMYIEDFLTHKLVKNKGQLPKYFVEGAHSPIIPRSVYQRVQEELWLRGERAKPGGTHFGSRRALVGRTYCPCGGKLQLLRRKTPVWSCTECRKRYEEDLPKRQVLAAIQRLPEAQAEVEENLSALSQKLAEPGTEDRETRAEALQKEWQLKTLLPTEEYYAQTPACTEENDFISRTSRRFNGWSDDEIVRILEKVIVDETVFFKGGVEVPIRT